MFGRSEGYQDSFGGGGGVNHGYIGERVVHRSDIMSTSGLYHDSCGGAN